MEYLQAKRKGMFYWALGLSIGFPAGVLMIIFGFIKGGIYIGMGITGIVLAIAGFYVMPLLWIRFGMLTKYTNYARQIINEGYRTVSLLAEQHGVNSKDVVNDIKTMIQKGYLPGFVLLDNERIVDKSDRRKFERMEAMRAGTLTKIKCPYCGAHFDIVLEAEDCPYCKSTVTRDMAEQLPLRDFPTE
jgi:hypothetical protein